MAHASSLEELPSATKEDKAQKALTQVRKKELQELRRVRVHSRDELRLEDGDKKDFLQKHAITGTKRQMEKRSYRSKLNEMLAAMAKKHNIEDAVENDPEFKKRLLKEMHVIHQREVRHHSRRISKSNM